eukprot:s345_g8.t1
MPSEHGCQAEAETSLGLQVLQRPSPAALRLLHSLAWLCKERPDFDMVLKLEDTIGDTFRHLLTSKRAFKETKGYEDEYEDEVENEDEDEDEDEDAVEDEDEDEDEVDYEDEDEDEDEAEVEDEDEDEDEEEDEVEEEEDEDEDEDEDEVEEEDEGWGEDEDEVEEEDEGEDEDEDEVEVGEDFDHKDENEDEANCEELREVFLLLEDVTMTWEMKLGRAAAMLKCAPTPGAIGEVLSSRVLHRGDDNVDEVLPRYVCRLCGFGAHKQKGFHEHLVEKHRGAGDERRAMIEYRKKLIGLIELMGPDVLQTNVQNTRDLLHKIRSLRQLCIQACETCEIPGERSRLLGVSLEYLLNDFVLEARQATSLQDPNFYVISGELASGENGKGKDKLCPRDKHMDCSIVDALDLEKLASPATHFLSWCWSYNLSMYTESWQFWLRENRKRGVRSGNVFVWQCLFCNNQYRIEENTNAINDSLGAIFRTRLLKIRKMVVLLDKFMAPKYLSRVWCVYEMYTALTSSEVSIDFMLPPQQASEIQDMIRDHGIKQIEESFERVNSESATAARVEDEDKVKHEIRQSPGGFAAVDSKVVEKMKEWVKQQFDRLMQQANKSQANKPTNAAAFLRKSGLDESVVQKLMKAGIKTYQDLLLVKDELQTSGIGLTQDEENAVHEVLQRGSGSNAATRNWKAELQELGLPYNCFAHLTEEEATGSTIAFWVRVALMALS